METVFNPHQSRTEQLNNFSRLVTTATTTELRASYMRQAAPRFALILKRNHANFKFATQLLYKPLEHIEVILSMPNNWSKDFAAVPLSEKDKEPLRLHAETLEHNPLEALENVLGLGYKVSVVWSENSQSFIVSLIGTDNTKFNGKKVLSSFSDDLGEAFFMGSYKLFIACPEQEWPTQQEQARWG